MVKKTKRQLILKFLNRKSCYKITEKLKFHPDKLIISLLLFLVGIFLLPQIAYFSSINEEKIIELTNQERIKNGLSIVTANQLLTKAAYEKGGAIIKTQSFKHTIDGRKFSTWIKESGYDYFYVGENLAIDFMTNEGVLKAWLESPTHKKNILNQNFTEIGVAVIEDKFQGSNTSLVVQIFGAPTTAAANIDNINNYPISDQSFSADYLLATINTNPRNNQGEILLTHSANQPIEKNLNFSPSTVSKNSNEYNSLSINQQLDKLLILLPTYNLQVKENNFMANDFNKIALLTYLILLGLILVKIYLHYYFRYLTHFKILFPRKK